MLVDHREALGFRIFEMVLLLKTEAGKSPTFIIVLSAPLPSWVTSMAPARSSRFTDKKESFIEYTGNNKPH